MSRTYELALVVEPRQSEDEVQAIAEKYKDMIEAGGDATVDEVDHWGKRKLAYPIQNLEEASYVFLYVTAEKAPPWPDVERNLMQSDEVIRHLVVRTDQDLKRAARAKVQPERIRGGETKETKGDRDRDRDHDRDRDRRR